MTTLENRPNTALLVIDVQNGVVEGAHERDTVVANVGSLDPGTGGLGALYAYRKVAVAGDRHRYRYVGPSGARPRRLYDAVEDLTGWDVLVVQKELESDDPRCCGAARSGCTRPRPARPAPTRPVPPRSRAGRS